MSRSRFQRQVFKLNQLSLWRENPRLLYTQADELACIAKLLESKSFMVLLEDIAKNGLSISPIVAVKIEDKFVVMDGNRRTAALKLLKNPDLCPSELSGLRDRILALAEKYPENVLSEVECLTTDERDAAIQYIFTTHTGAQGGLGQVNWDALVQAAFGVAENVSANYKHAYRLLRLAQSHGFNLSGDYPISTLDRFAIKDFCEKFGIEYSSDTAQPLKVIDDYPSAVAALLELVSDIGNGNINVSMNDEGSMRGNASLREQYFDQLYAKHYKVNSKDNQEGKDGGSEPESKPKPEPSPDPKPKQPPKPTWDRRKFIPAKRHTKVPRTHVKEYNVFADTVKLMSQDTPISCAVMLRVLFEATLKKTVKALGSQWRSKSLAKNTEFVAEQMLKLGRIDTPLRDAIVKISGKDQPIAETFFSIDTIQSIMHSQHFHPSKQDVNTFWDNLDPFIAKCWELIEHSEEKQ